jgi:hypothetical protein
VTPVSRNRVLSAGAVALYLVGARAALPDEGARGALHYAVVATLGYGHLLGAVWTGRRSRRGALRAAFGGVAVANLFLAYVLGAARWPGVVLPLLAVSAWHAVENDGALAQAYRAGGRLGPLPRDRGAQLVSLGGTLIVVAAASGARLPPDVARALGGWPLLAPRLLLAAAAAIGLRLLREPRRRVPAACLAAAGAVGLSFGAPPLDLADVFAATGLHHLVSWLVLLADRAKGARVRRALLAHGIALGGALGLGLAPESRAAAAGAALAAPPVYLFFAALHVAQTALRRGLAPGARP